MRRRSCSLVEGFLYKVVHKIGRLRKFNRDREIEFNLFPAGTRKSLLIPLKFFALATVGKEEVLAKSELNLINTFRNTAMFPGGNVGGLGNKYIQKKGMYKEF